MPTGFNSTVTLENPLCARHCHGSAVSPGVHMKAAVLRGDWVHGRMDAVVLEVGLLPREQVAEKRLHLALSPPPRPPPPLSLPVWDDTT